jgi:hypothetical protein
MKNILKNVLIVYALRRKNAAHKPLFSHKEALAIWKVWGKCVCKVPE